MLLTFIKTSSGLVAADDDTYETVKKLPVGGEVYFEYKPKRNYRFHKKLFALLNFILSHQSYYKDIDNILEIVKFRAGYFDTILMHNGKKHFKTKSISFEKMDNTEFEKFYGKVIDVAVELVGVGREDLENEILRFL